jgi:hypothetical protein
MKIGMNWLLWATRVPEEHYPGMQLKPAHLRKLRALLGKARHEGGAN